MTVAVLTGPPAMLGAEWDGLWRRAGRPPFLAPAWLLPWWDAFGTAQPRLVAARAGGTLVGLLPLYLLQEGGARKLLPMGVGISDYHDALIDPAAPPGTAAALLHAALAGAAADGATECTLPELPPGAALRPVPAPPGWVGHDAEGAPCPVLTLADGVPAGMARNVRQSRHRADRSGGWQAGAAPAVDAIYGWECLMAFHRARWTALGHPDGVLADPAVTAFHQAAVPRLAEAGVLRMQVLRIAGAVAAVYHTLLAPGRLFFYLSGFDAGYGQISPGTLLLGHLVEEARAAGLAELHFLRGAEPYKYAWGARDRMNLARTFRPG